MGVSSGLSRHMREEFMKKERERKSDAGEVKEIDIPVSNERDWYRKKHEELKANAKVLIGSCLNCGEQICNTGAMDLIRRVQTLESALKEITEVDRETYEALQSTCIKIAEKALGKNEKA